MMTNLIGLLLLLLLLLPQRSRWLQRMLVRMQLLLRRLETGRHISDQVTVGVKRKTRGRTC